MLNKNIGRTGVRKVVLGSTIVAAMIAVFGGGLFIDDSPQQINGESVQLAPRNPKEPVNPYEKLDAKVAQNVRAYAHYRLTDSDRPSVDEVKKYMVEIVALGCGDPKICNYFLWDSKEAYEAGKSSVEQGLASEVALANKVHLAGYINSGHAFYYYGTTGKGGDSFTTLDVDSGVYFDFY